MKKVSFTLLSVLFCLTLSRAQAEWIPQALGVLPEGYGINDISAVNEEVVWAIANNSAEPTLDADQEYILKSIDGGNAWDTIPLGDLSQLEFVSLSAVSGDVAWLSMNDGQDAFFYQTTNGGLDWALKYTLEGLPNKVPYPVLEFVDEDRGYFVCLEVKKSGKTMDGTNWTVTPFTLNGFYVYSTGAGNLLEAKGDTLFWGTSDRIAKSTNGGMTWGYTYPDFPGMNTIYSIAFDDTGYGLAISDGDDALPSPLWFLDHTIILKSEDFGASWEFLPDVDFPLTAMSEIPGEEKTFVAVSGVWGWWDTTYVGPWTSAYTLDGGVNWAPIDQDIPYTSISFASINAGWVGAVGNFDYGPDKPALFKFNLMSGTKEFLVAEPNISLFPNPATDLLNVEWPETLNGPVTVSIYTIQGALVRQSSLPVGQSLEVSALPPGLYTLKLVEDGKVFVGQFAKL